MKLVVDTREQRSYREYFEHEQYPHIIKKLDVGDYSIEGCEKIFAIERKSLNDFIDSITFFMIRLYYMS